jgi:hypothetical protein
MEAPISHHLDLYRYWLAKRGRRAMPARSDINPGDIPTLLPYLMLVDKADGQFRWRLAGTAVVQEVGREPTGSVVGSYSSTTAAAARAIYERVFTTACPIFAAGEFKITSHAVHNMSLLALPLSDNAADVNMAVSTLIARFSFGVDPSTDWLKDRPVQVLEMVDIDNAEQLEERCRDWERRRFTPRTEVRKK